MMADPILMISHSTMKMYPRILPFLSYFQNLILGKIRPYLLQIFFKFRTFVVFFVGHQLYTYIELLQNTTTGEYR